MYIFNVFDVCFIGLFVFERDTYNRLKSVSTILKVKNEFFFAKSSTFGAVQTGHLHTCPLHLKLMSTTSLSYILHNKEIRDDTLDYIFHSQQKRIALKIFRLLIFDLKLFPIGCDLSCPLIHRY